MIGSVALARLAWLWCWCCFGLWFGTFGVARFRFMVVVWFGLGLPAVRMVVVSRCFGLWC